MRIMADNNIRRLTVSLIVVLAVFDILLQAALYAAFGRFSAAAGILSLCLTAAVMLLCVSFLRKQDKLLENAVAQTARFLAGEEDARIDCDEEGELYRLFQSVNTLSSALCAHAERERARSEFLKNTISDISHQLKTPLAALSIYNGLIADAGSIEDARRFVESSEGELDRMEKLVKDLLKLTRLDAGAITLEKHPENLADIMDALARRFACRAESEGKQIILDGGDDILRCDSSWLSEALGNILKNALDHTTDGGVVNISWKRQGGIQNISIRDNGSGIHPDDIHHIFKRFYRSRFSKDTQGIGLGLPLAKAVIEAHGGTIEVESSPGQGALFSINFLIPTEL